MFIDRMRIQVSAGRGGNGIVAWTRRKYIPKGGPCGGNGGRGGDVYLDVDTNAGSLEWYWNQHDLRAEDGACGGGNLCHGRKGKDLILKVPVGTQVYDEETGEILVDITKETPRILLCRGGRGGYGNEHFKSSTNRAPGEWTPGKLGKQRRLLLELKLIADVGLLGLPNAGKSSLLKQLTKAPVKTAAYPFTTLSPNLACLEFEDYRHLILADVPGIIEGAHENRGLGLEFLRHIERTKILLWVLDASASDGRDPVQDYCTLRDELMRHNPELLQRPHLILLNKMDLEGAEAFAKDFYREIKTPCDQVIEISAFTGTGLELLKKRLEVFAHV